MNDESRQAMAAAIRANARRHTYNPDMNEFWVYENWTVQKAVLHRGGCGSCNHGRGIWGGGKTPNGKWHGPYASEELAKSAPIQPQREIRGCGLCMK